MPTSCTTPACGNTASRLAVHPRSDTREGLDYTQLNALAGGGQFTLRTHDKPLRVRATEPLRSSHSIHTGLFAQQKVTQQQALRLVTLPHRYATGSSSLQMRILNTDDCNGCTHGSLEHIMGGQRYSTIACGRLPRGRTETGRAASGPIDLSHSPTTRSFCLSVLNTPTTIQFRLNAVGVTLAPSYGYDLIDEVSIDPSLP